MFPMVPNHPLPRQHDIIWHDLPEPCPSRPAAFTEMWRALHCQLNEDDFVNRTLPATAKPCREDFHGAALGAAAE